MTPPVRGTIDCITNDFEMTYHYANPIYFRCLCQAPAEVLFSFPFIVDLPVSQLSSTKTFSKDYNPSD